MTRYLANVMRSEGDPKVIRSGPSSFKSSDRLARALGWFSSLGFSPSPEPRPNGRVKHSPAYRLEAAA
jgi:hypothetical protein